MKIIHFLFEGFYLFQVVLNENYISLTKEILIEKDIPLGTLADSALCPILKKDNDTSTKWVVILSWLEYPSGIFLISFFKR